MKNFLKKFAAWFHGQVEKGKKNPRRHSMRMNGIDFNNYAPPTESLIDFQVIRKIPSRTNSRFP